MNYVKVTVFWEIMSLKWKIKDNAQTLLLGWNFNIVIIISKISKINKWLNKLSMKRKIIYQGETRCFLVLFMSEKVPLLQTNQLTLRLLIGCNGWTLKEQNKPNFTTRL